MTLILFLLLQVFFFLCLILRFLNLPFRFLLLHYLQFQVLLTSYLSHRFLLPVSYLNLPTHDWRLNLKSLPYDGYLEVPLFRFVFRLSPAPFRDMAGPFGHLKGILCDLSSDPAIISRGSTVG